MKLQLDGIHMSYQRNCVLDDMHATIERGVTGLLGPNGAGKTTLIRILVDVLPPTRGRILLDGEDIKELDEAYRERIGYLPQDVAYYPTFTGLEFLECVAALKGMGKRAARKRIEEIAPLVGLEGELTKQCRQYSGGMRRRLGIAQCLLNDPDILVFDEPTAGLDPSERIRFRNLIAELSRDRIILISTHIVSDIERIAGTILLLNRGRCIHWGTGEELCDRANGHIWALPRDMWDRLPKQRERANLISMDHDSQVRIVADERPFPGAFLVEPSLEDAYLYLTAKGSMGHEAARMV